MYKFADTRRLSRPPTPGGGKPRPYANVVCIGPARRGDPCGRPHGTRYEFTAMPPLSKGRCPAGAEGFQSPSHAPREHPLYTRGPLWWYEFAGGCRSSQPGTAGASGRLLPTVRSGTVHPVGRSLPDAPLVPGTFSPVRFRYRNPKWLPRGKVLVAPPVPVTPTRTWYASVLRVGPILAVARMVPGTAKPRREIFPFGLHLQSNQCQDPSTRSLRMTAASMPFCCTHRCSPATTSPISLALQNGIPGRWEPSGDLLRNYFANRCLRSQPMARRVKWRNGRL